jgi:chromosomal replication initiation ATPase DnaA
MYSGITLYRGPASLESHLKITSKKADIPIFCLKGRSRKPHIVMVRRIFAYNMLKLGFSLKSIGDSLGGRDHSSIIHYKNTYKDLRDTNNLQFIYYKNLINKQNQ